MNIFNIFESPKLAAPSNTPGAQDIGDQHSPSPIGSGTSKREAKKKPVTMMGVPVKEEQIVEVWEPLTEGQVPNFLDDDFYAYDPDTKEIKSTWSHKSVGRRHSEYQAQQQGWKVVSGMSARSLGLHYPEKKVDEGGPFSYGAKKPRKGSVADLAAKKRKEQEQGKQPAEPRDHMVGVARVVKEYGDTPKGQKQLTRVHKRAVDRLIKADDKNRLEPDYTKRDLKTVRKNQATADRAWDRFTDLDLDEASVYKKDQDLSSIPTQELEAFVRKHWGGGIPTYGQGKSVQRAMRELRRRQKQGMAEGIGVVDQDYDLDQMILTLDIEGKKVSFTYWDYDENFANAERRDVFDQLQEQPWYKGLDHPTKMEILDAAYRAIRGLEPQKYRPTVDDEPLDEQGVAEGEKKPHPKTWHDVDPKLGKQVDKMSQAEKVKKGFAHPDTLKKKGVAEGPAQEKLYKRHQELRKKSGLPDPDYYKELKATYDLPDDERYAKAAELKKKYNVKEGILDRSPAKLPKPRNPAEKVLRSKVNAAGQHTNKKRQQQLQPKHRGRDDLDEGWKSAVAGAALAGAAALGGGAAQAGDLEKSIGPLPVMATITIKMPDGETKTIKKDLGHAYDYKLDDAKKDIENLLDKKGIKQYTIHLDRYNSNDAYLDRDAMKSGAKDYSAKSNYVDSSPYQAKYTKTDYMDRTPYTPKSTKHNYSDPANYEESIEEMDRRGFLKAMGGAALAGAGVSAAAQQVDTMARVVMIVNGEQVERVINLGPVSSPQAAERQLANELRARGIEQFQISLERGAPPQSAPVNTRPGPHGARSIAGPGGVVDTAGQVAGDIQDGDWRSAVKKGYKTYQNNRNADMGAIGRAEVKDRIIKGVVGGLGLDEDLNEDMDRHLYQLQLAGYDIINETDAIKGADGKRCWKGKRYAGTKKGKDICVDVNEEKKGLYYYVNQRKKKGISRPKGHEKAPSAQDWKDAAKTAKK